MPDNTIKLRTFPISGHIIIYHTSFTTTDILKSLLNFYRKSNI